MTLGVSRRLPVHRLASLSPHRRTARGRNGDPLAALHRASDGHGGRAAGPSRCRSPRLGVHTRGMRARARDVGRRSVAARGSGHAGPGATGAPPRAALGHPRRWFARSETSGRRSRQHLSRGRLGRRGRAQQQHRRVRARQHRAAGGHPAGRSEPAGLDRWAEPRARSAVAGPRRGCEHRRPARAGHGLDLRRVPAYRRLECQRSDDRVRRDVGHVRGCGRRVGRRSVEGRRRTSG